MTWVEQKFFSKGKLVSSTLVQTLFRKKGKNVTTPELMGIDHHSPPITDEIKHLEKLEPLE